MMFSEGQNAARALIAGPQRYSCLVGGARAGKTFILLRAILHRALRAPGSRHAVLRFHANAARAAIARDTLPKIMRLCFPRVKSKLHRADGFLELANGSQIWIGGLDDKDRVEKILGLEYATVFLNEASQIPYASALVAFTRLAQVVPGLRQRGFVDLNPVGKAHWTNRLFGEGRDPVSGRPLANPEDYRRAFLNPSDNARNLSREFLASLESLPEKQRKRFFEGVYLDEIDGALWTYETLEACRCEPDDIAEAKRAAAVVAVDPSGAASREDRGADEIGLIVAARGTDGCGYILDDRSLRAGPREWARAAVVAFHHYRADCIVAESNFGGEMVRATILAADPNVPVRLVAASRGKAVRAEPISVRYEQGQVRHAGRFGKLEDQLCAFTASGYRGEESPDRADAAIWALTYLLAAADGTGLIEFYRRAVEQGLAAPSGRFAAQTFRLRLRAPAGVSMAYGRSGACYRADADGVVVIAEAVDVEPLRAAGFTDA
jgi:Terminase RNaseH-like domain/Phage terminase large subunit